MIGAGIMTKTQDEASPEAAKIAAKISPAAQRALDEAAARRAEYVQNEAHLPKEIGGRKGLEPGRYGDWEIKGLTSAF